MNRRLGRVLVVLMIAVVLLPLLLACRKEYGPTPTVTQTATVPSAVHIR